MKLKDLNIRQYRAIGRVAKNPDTISAWLDELPNIVEGMTPEKADRLSIDELLNYVKMIEKAVAEPVNQTIERWDKYTLRKNMSAGMFIDLTELSKQDITQNLHLIMSVVWKDKQGNSNADDFDVMPLEVAFGTTAFFLQQSIALQTALALYSNQAVKVDNQRGANRSIKSGIGIWLLRQFSKAQVTIGRKLLNLQSKSS